MGRYLSIPLLLVAVVLQATIIPEFRIGDGGPDLIVLLVLSWALLAGVGDGYLWAMIGGILQDLLNGLPVGTTALGLVVAVFVINSLFRTVGRSNLVLPVLAIALGTAAYHTVLIVLLSVLGRAVPIGYSLLNITIPTVIFNMVLVLPIFRVLGLVYAASQPKRVTLS